MPYFFDTCALVEIMEGNESYYQFSSEKIYVSILNIGELYLVNLREKGKEHALNVVKKLKFTVFEIDWGIIINAIDFKNKHNKREFSWPDSIGYALAEKHKMKFLTGDRQFEDLENVKFVK